MGTPLRFLLTPKQKISFSAVRKVKSCESTKDIAAKPLRENAVKPHGKHHIPQYQNTPTILINNALEPYQRHKKCLAIDTPERKKLLKCGLQNKNYWHVIGTGSFGTVIEAKYKGKKVAVKVIKPMRFCDISERNMLGLEHENIIKTFDVISGKDYTHCIIIMEYIENTEALNSILENKMLDIKFDFIFKVIIGVCRGLQYLHQSNLIHLDLKPANILVCPNMICKLCDFGSCMKINGGQDVKYKHKGTLIYTSPEILLGKLPTPKSDVYSLGIVMWQLKTRETPFGDIDSSDVLIYKVVKYKLRPNVAACEKNAYTQLLCECWEADPSTRPEVSTIITKIEAVKVDSVKD